MRAKRRVALDDRLEALRRQIQGIESENAYIRGLIRRCGEESLTAPADELDRRVAELSDHLRRNTEYLRQLSAEELALARRADADA